MTPAPAADIIVNVRLGPLNGLVGYVTVEGHWGDSGAALYRDWKASRAAPTGWKLLGRLIQRAWQEANR